MKSVLGRKSKRCGKHAENYLASSPASVPFVIENGSKNSETKLRIKSRSFSMNFAPKRGSCGRRIEKVINRLTSPISPAVASRSNSSLVSSHPEEIYTNLPLHLISSNLTEQAAETLFNENFISNRIKVLGMLEGAKVHVSDCERLMSQKNHDDLLASRICNSPTSVADISSNKPGTKHELSEHSMDSYLIYAEQSAQTILSDEDVSKFLDLLLVFGTSLAKFLNIDNAMDIYKMALTLPSSIGLSHPHNASGVSTMAKIYNQIGDIQGKCGDIEDAIISYKNALKLYGYFPNNAEIAKTFTRMGNAFGSMGDLDEAMKSYQNAHEKNLQVSGPKDLEAARSLHNIGVVYRHMNELDSAMEAYQEALDILKRELGPEDLELANTMNNIAGVHRRRREYDDAIRVYKDVLRIRREKLGDYHPRIDLTLIAIGYCLRRSGRKKEAKKFYDEAMK
mmetsp:Transcript_36553/g.44112  ORF Transcript_36553/g.44112 Transcript_36553/m.44112 type:complete len:452 (-) Transcript_36553:127-1482(-)